MEVDEALGKLGAVGKWQILYYTMISTATMVPSCFHMLAINYIGKWTTLVNGLIDHPTFSLPKIFPCSPGYRWMAFGLRRAKLLG